MEDIKILELFEARNETALIETSKKYGAYLLKICMNILGIKEDSEECVNDTYNIAWNKIPPEKPLNFLPYLGRISKNIALNRYDYLTASKRNTHFDSVLSELSDMGSDDVFENISEKELSKSISDFLRKCNETVIGETCTSVEQKDSLLIEPSFRIGNSISGFTLDESSEKIEAYAIYTNWNWENPIN